MRYYILVTIIFLIFSCEKENKEDSIAMKNYKMEEGFEMEVIAAEPLLKAPVAIDFDSKGRMWVAQMPGYMNDMQGSDEDKPVGSIVILEDLDADGIADRSKVFLDSLVMPRAIAHVYGGLLYAEPPFLYFVDIENDQPVNRIVVDSVYAADGNPEHQPNGLLLNIDNWIYNAKSNFRYRRINDVWKKESTTFRGQWGISQDNFGRLYFNNNSTLLLGDHLLPNRVVRNKHFTPKKSVNKLLTEDQRVYPLHATTVNRGYAKGILNADSILIHTTAAAGLSVYRGGAFGDDYAENVFVSVPEGNLIKRMTLTFHGDSTSAKQAWENKEFLASTDEGFRPVTIKNGPGGGLYIVDMHRGMIGHHAYLSPYLKKKNEAVRLDTILDYGRIIKVTKESNINTTQIDFEALTASQLVGLLNDSNGWVRDRAQHFLIFKNQKKAISELKTIALNTNNEIAQIHALYVLEGLNALNFDLLVAVGEESSANVVGHAIVLLENFASKRNRKKALQLFKKMIQRNDKTIDVYLSSSFGKWLPHDRKAFFHNILFMLKKHKGNSIIQESILSGIGGNEQEILKGLQLVSYDDAHFLAALKEVIQMREENMVNAIFSRKSLNEDNRTAGAKMFFQICASCHGSNGEGIEGLAPPLLKSEHVADVERLALIVLHGLQGPISVNGVGYNFDLTMPGLIRNSEISDKDIAAIIAYVSNAFSDEPQVVKKERISELREKTPLSKGEYTMPELLQFSKN